MSLANQNDFVLLHFCLFARRDDFVGQAGSLRPIVNRPNVANVQHSSFAACRHAGRVGNPPAFGGRRHTGETPSLFTPRRDAERINNPLQVATSAK
jgi:hypothetical protein